MRELLDLLQASLGAPVRLSFTRNRRVMLSWRRGRDGVTVRLHQVFLDAPEKIRAVLARHLAQPTAGTRRAILDYAATRHSAEAVPPRRSPRVRLVTRGRVHDLAAIFARLNAAHFEGRLATAVTWGKNGSAGRRRSIRFGSYHPEQRLIRIHPALDQEFVPEYFVASIVHHEMLHAHLGVPETGRGRRMLHGRAFRALERAFPGHDRAQAWMRTHLGRLLR